MDDSFDLSQMFHDGVYHPANNDNVHDTYDNFLVITDKVWADLSPIIRSSVKKWREDHGMSSQPSSAELLNTIANILRNGDVIDLIRLYIEKGPIPFLGQVNQIFLIIDAYDEPCEAPLHP